MKQKTYLTWLLVLILWGSACGGEETPPPPPIGEGDTAVATPTLSAATATPLPAPPTVAPTLGATPSPEADAALLLDSAADFAPDRNPLTGEEVADPAILQRRPLAIKLSNAPAIYTRPQSGLNQADLVFEHTTEGNITRFTAIFYGETPQRVGPVRSARLIDLELPAMYHAALAFSGSSAGVGQRLSGSDFSQRLIYGWESGFYRSGENKPFEHTLYADPVRLWETLAEKGQNRPPEFDTYVAFSSETPEGGDELSAAVIDYDWTVVEWRYDPDLGRYRRWSDGEVHADGNSGEQVTAANVIILAPTHVEDATICEEIRNGACFALSVQIQLWGSGIATVLRDGRAYGVNWHRQDRGDMLTFTQRDGSPFPLQIGNSWIQLVPTWLQDPVSLNP